MNKAFTVTAEDAREIHHKLQIFAENPDAELSDGTPLSDEQRQEIMGCIPRGAGDWTPPEWALEVIAGEMRDHANVLRDIAGDARRNNERGQALRIDKQAKKFETLFP